MKKMIFAVALCLMATFAVANLAQANYSNFGKVGFVYEGAYDYDSSTNNALWGYIFLTPQNYYGLGLYTQYCYTRNANMLIQAKIALANNTTFRMNCSGTFPTSGSYRYGGYVKNLYMHSSY